jgi:hypothetical protein
MHETDLIAIRKNLADAQGYARRIQRDTTQVRSARDRAYGKIIAYIEAIALLDDLIRTGSVKRTLDGEPQTGFYNNYSGD